MLDQLNVMRVASTPAHSLPILSTLLSHPDVQDGLHAGIQTFQGWMFEEDHEKAWDEQDIIQFVNHELAAKSYQWEQQLEKALGGPFISYLHHLGFVLGYLDQALVATRPGETQPEEQATRSTAQTSNHHEIDLGAHHLVVQDDQSIELMPHQREQAASYVLHLDSGEAYRLMSSLQDMYKRREM